MIETSSPLVATASTWVVLELDLSVRSATLAQTAVAVSILGLFMALLIVFGYRSRYNGLSASEKRHKSAITGARYDQTPKSIRIPGDEDPGIYRELFRDLFDRSHLEPVDDRTTLREALIEARAAFGESTAPIVELVPGLSLRLFQTATLVAIFGAIAVSTDAIVRQLKRDASLPSLSVIVERAVEITGDVVATGIDVVASFPFFGTIFSLAFAYAVLLWELLYRNWWFVAIALVLGGILIWYLDRRLEDQDVETQLYQDRTSLALVVVERLAIVWISGVVPAYVWARVGLPDVGALLGFAIASIVGILFVYRGSQGFRARLEARSRIDADDRDNVIAGYLLARRIFGAFAVAAAPLIPVYVVVSIATGRLARILAALATATVGIQLLALLAVLGVVAVVAYLIRESYPELRSALVETGSRRNVRVALLARGLPYAAVVLAYLVSFGLFASFDLVSRFVLALVVAIAVGLGAHYLYRASIRAKYRVSLYEPAERLPSRLVVLGYVLEDADGREHYLARVNDQELAADDVDVLVDEIVRVGRELLAEGETSPCVASWFASVLQERGIVDEQETLEKVREKVRKQTFRSLRDENRRIQRDALNEALADYPSWIAEDRLKEFRLRGQISEREGFVYLERDPFVN